MGPVPLLLVYTVLMHCNLIIPMIIILVMMRAVVVVVVLVEVEVEAEASGQVVG